MTVLQGRQEGILEIRDAFFIADFLLHGLVCRNIPVMAVHGQEQDHIAVLAVLIVPVQEPIGIGSGLDALRRGDGDYSDAYTISCFCILQDGRHFSLFCRRE